VRKPATAGELADVNHNLANYRAILLLGRLIAVKPSTSMRAARDAALLAFSGRYRGHTPHAPAYGSALLWALEEPLEITIIGFEQKSREFLAVANAVPIPQKAVRLLSPSRDAGEIRRLNYPLREAVYLCAGKRCSRPLRDPAAFKAALEDFLPPGGRQR
jgi:uncharacterized protein YyaL (SSP411 family)